MKRVTLFKVVTEELMVADHAEFYEQMHMPMLSSAIVQGSGEMACSPVGKKITMPIRKHMRRTELSLEYLELCGQGHYYQHPVNGYSTEETYIAIDPAAERVIDIEIVEMLRLREAETVLRRNISKLEHENEGYNSVIEEIKAASLWTRIKWVFTGVN